MVVVAIWGAAFWRSRRAVVVAVVVVVIAGGVGIGLAVSGGGGGTSTASDAAVSGASGAACRDVSLACSCGGPPPVQQVPPIATDQGPPTAPKNNKVAIFSKLTFNGTFPALSQDQLNEDAKLKALLEQDGYQVTLFNSHTDPPAGLVTFDQLANYGIVIINTHGEQASPKDVKPDTQAATVVDSYSVSDQDETALLHQLGYRNGWFQLGNGNLELTAPGIEHAMHLGSSGPPTLVVNSSCWSMSLASAYGARDYFGYLLQAADRSELHPPLTASTDQQELFEDLLGDHGMADRLPPAAFAAGTWSTVSPTWKDFYYWHQPGTPTTVLSPAVQLVSPPDGSAATPGQTGFAVSFDAAMDETDPTGDLEASGSCDPTIKPGSAHWSNPTTLDAVVQVPYSAPLGCSVQMQVKNPQTVGGGGGWPAVLDGNGDPSGTNGQVPNDDPYTWTYASGSPATTTTTTNNRTVTVEYSGTYKETAYNWFEGSTEGDPIVWDYSWDATSTYNTATGTATRWHYTTLNGSAQETINEPQEAGPPAIPCQVGFGETPGFETTTDDDSGISPIGDSVTIHVVIPYEVEGLLAVTSGAEAGFCSLDGPAPSFPEKAQLQYDHVIADTITVGLNSPPHTTNLDFSNTPAGLTVDINSTVTVTPG
jgi:hypothetical protein